LVLDLEGAEAAVVPGADRAVVVVAAIAERLPWPLALRSTPKVATKPATRTTAIPIVTGDTSRSAGLSGLIRGIWISP